MKPSALDDRAEALRALAALLRLGYPTRAALVEWSRHAPDCMESALTPLGRAIAMGLPTPAAIARVEAFKEDGRALASSLKLAAELGGNSAAMVESLASSIEARSSSVSAARSASSGARLSGRLIAGLPLAFLPLFPMSRDQLLSGPNRFSLVAGIALLVLGMTWIARLVPRPHSSDDPVAAVADLLAAVLTGGVGLAQSLDAIAQTPPAEIDNDMKRARRLNRLGLSWPDALAAVDDPALDSLAATLRRAQQLGLPVSDSLIAFGSLRRSERDREFETRNKRATVFMLIPLALCVLPAFILLAIAPFLRGLSVS